MVRRKQQDNTDDPCMFDQILLSRSHSYNWTSCHLYCTEWEQKFPLSTVEALTREISDHTPLLLDTNQASHRRNTHLFKFELGWLTRDEFFRFDNRCVESWKPRYNTITTMAKQDQSGPYISAWLGEKPSRRKQKKKKFSLLHQLDILDRKAESTLLSPQELEHKRV